jgi:glycosyltransferase involved in cell wall biosynthesis
VTRPPITVVVPTRDRPELLAGCLAALAIGLGAGDEVVVVDSASIRSDVAAVAARFGARCVRCDRPGTSRARNAGWAAATTDLVAFVDDDVRVTHGWADALAGALAARPWAAFVTGRLDLAPDEVDVDRPVAIKTDTTGARLDRTTRGVLGHSASLCVRRDAVASIGGFDEALGPGTPLRAAEDNDLFDRLLAAGHVGWYEPSALAHHRQWRTRRQLVGLDAAYGVGTGARLRKLLAADRPRARAVAGAVGRNLATAAWAGIRNRYELELVLVAARVAGIVTGFTRAAIRPVRDGKLVDRKRVGPRPYAKLNGRNDPVGIRR